VERVSTDDNGIPGGSKTKSVIDNDWRKHYAASQPGTG